MRISFASAVLVAVAACNNLLGLEPSLLDMDHDGVGDATDNCTFEPNPQQRDSDHNGLGDVCDCLARGADADTDGIDDACDDCIGVARGEDSGGDGIDDGCQPCAAADGDDVDADGLDDACDACTLGPPHDEDHDGVADSCDNCPTQSNPDQAPAGVVGAACVRGVASWQRFDPLVDQDITLWPGSVTGWTWVDDGLTVRGVSARSLLLVPGQAYTLETRATTAGELSLECVTSNNITACAFDQPQRRLAVSTTLGLGGGLPAYQVAFSPPLPPSTGSLRYQLRVDPAIPRVFCEALDAAGGVIVSASLDDSLPCQRFKIRTTADSHLDYLWIVSE